LRDTIGLPRLHERVFRRLGGTVRVVVLDNLKEGALTPTSVIRGSIRCIATYWPTERRLRCRVASNGKVEAGVGHVKKTPLRGLRFESLGAIYR
jgi:hypothetical protein